MDGILLQTINLVLATKHFLSHRNYYSEHPSYIKNSDFYFSCCGSQREKKCISSAEWLNELHKRGLKSINLLNKTRILKLDVFTHLATDYCFQTICNNQTSYWLASWSYVASTAQWTTMYQENLLDNALTISLAADDRIGCLVAILEEIGDFAEEIGEQDWAQNHFYEALSILNGKFEFSAEFPEKNIRLLEAAKAAFVFGGMGSWNDSPPESAKQCGLGKTYDVLSARLYDEIMYAIMHAVNEW